MLLLGATATAKDEPVRSVPLESVRLAPAAGNKPALKPIGRAEGLSTVLLLITNPVAPHYHAKHDEMVMILDGGGVFTLGKKRTVVLAGDHLTIPRGTIHAFEPGSPTRVLSTFGPAFDGKDRIWVHPK